MLKNNEPQEQLEFLKREEVRTMAKDIAQLREEEAKKERDRITKIKPEEPKKEAQAPTRTPQSQPIPPSLMPHIEGQKPALPRAKTRPEKILIRVIVIGILLFLVLNGLAFGYWYLTRKQVVEVTPSTQLIEPEGSSEPERPVPSAETEEPVAQPPAPEPSLVSLFRTLHEKEDARGLTKIPVKDRVSELPFPSQLKEIIQQDEFVIFSFVSQDKKRLGFIFQLQNSQGAQEILLQWEPSMEDDLKTLWDIIGQKGSAYVPFFRQTTYLNNLVRFQTFSVIDFGIVYSLVGTKLILTTSFESLTKAVDLLAQSGQ